jgi:hypothetical protein
VSVREVEELVRGLGKQKAPVAGKSGLPARYEKAKLSLHGKLLSKVDLKVNKKGAGSIIIEFKSAEDFDRIISKLDS